jgi:hypothetical protein
MEVIDDCFVAFFGAIHPIDSQFSCEQEKKTDDWRKQKKLKFYLSLMSTTLFVMS